MKNRLPSLPQQTKICVICEGDEKKVNAPLIEECTGVSNYKAREDQRQQVFEQITKENYVEMLDRVKKLSDDDSVVGSSNFGEFMDCFSGEDDSWISEINETLNEALTD